MRIAASALVSPSALPVAYNSHPSLAMNGAVLIAGLWVYIFGF
jgi:hypothetical protein